MTTDVLYQEIWYSTVSWRTMSWDIYVKKKKPENNKTANYIYNYVPVIDLIDTKSSPNSPLNQYIFNKIKFTRLYNCHVYIKHKYHCMGLQWKHVNKCRIISHNLKYIYMYIIIARGLILVLNTFLVYLAHLKQILSLGWFSK